MKDTQMSAQHNNPVKVVNGTSGLDHTKQISASIAQRAYEIFEEDGRNPGRELEHWFRAESELLHPIHAEIALSDDAIIARAEVPGYRAEELEVAVAPRRVTIEGKREARAQHNSDVVIFTEHCVGRVFRTLELPIEINTSKATATLKDGVLEIALPKVAGATKPRAAAR